MLNVSIKYHVLSIKGLVRHTKYKIQNTKYCKTAGFTLIEFLIVMGILALVVGSTTIFLSSILKGSNQANANSEVKQNAQAVLDSVERQIRGAVDAYDMDDGRHLVIIRRDSSPLHIKCLYRSVDASDKIVRNDRLATVVSDLPNPADSNYLSVSNDDPETGVNIDTNSCEFKVTPAVVNGPRISPAVISLKFTATQGLNAPRRADFNASADFETTISLRTYE